jgi:alkylation response protein AidB-like acyl-CoA dehydrogenase
MARCPLRLAAGRQQRGVGDRRIKAMDAIIEDTHLPADIDAQPVVQAAIALRPEVRRYSQQIEREQRLSPPLVEQLHAAGLYRMVLPRSLGGLQVDPLTFLRVVELLSEGSGSVGWNVCNNSIGQLVTLGLADDGVHELYPSGHATVIAGTAVQGGGQAVPVPGGYRISGRWSFGTGCQEAKWMLAPPCGWWRALLARAVPARRSRGCSRKLGRCWAARNGQLRLDRDRRLPARASDHGPCRRAAR